MTSRGLRNNNPGNIDRHPDTQWQGAAADQSSDPRFVVFTAPEWGIRAIARLMLTYQNQHGLRTVRALIGRWAPPAENQTTAYVTAVARALGVDPDAEIDVEKTAVMLPLVKAIIEHENGAQPYSDAVLLDGLRRAGVSDAPPKPLMAQGHFQAQAGAAASAAVAGAVKVSAYAPTVKDWAGQLDAYAGAPLVAHAISVLLTVAGGLALLGLAAQILKQRKLA